MMRARQRRTVLEWLAVLTTLALLFQVLAVDHWTGRAAQAADLDQHAQHCHGGPGCADSQSPLQPGNVAGSVRVVPPEPRMTSIASASTGPQEALVPAPDQPPRSS